MNETRTITTSDGEMSVVVNHPDGDGPFPVVVFFHHGPGLDDGSREAIKTISDAGYYVIAPDRYYRHGKLIVMDMHKMMAPDADPADRERFQEIFTGTTDDMVERDVQAVLGYLKTESPARPAPMGAIGYCIGARTVLRCIEHHGDVFKVGILLHPSFCTTEDSDSPHKVVEGFDGYIYVGIGSEDQMQSPEANKPLIDAVGGLGDRGNAEVHEGADHGFAVPGAAYHQAAASRSYAQALDMFEKALA
ncbi:MAG: dienelactone hydrolase family protein [Acidimicrobiales bacterium]